MDYARRNLSPALLSASREEVASQNAADVWRRRQQYAVARSVVAEPAIAEHRWISRQPSMARTRPGMVEDPCRPFLPPQNPASTNALVVVLDLDETLIYARDGVLRQRPGLAELFRTLQDSACETIIWTAGEREYAQNTIARIDPLGAVQHCIYRHAKWWTGRPGYAKNLRALGRPLDRCVMVDNTPDCLREQQDNSVLVRDYTGGAQDNSLYHVARVLARVASMRTLASPVALSRCPELCRRIVQCDTTGAVNVFTLEGDAILGSTVYHETHYNPDVSRSYVMPW